MRWLLAAFVAMVAAVTIAVLVWTSPNTIAADDVPDHVGDPVNGRYVFFAAGCNSCHAAADARGDEVFRLGGGRPLKTPFGTFYAPNISPSPDGIGGWTDLEFVNAVMRGVSPDGDHYYPALPYLSYQRMKIEDVLDLKAFLDTLPPVAGKAPPHDLPLLFRFRRGLGVWKRLYMDYRPFQPDPDADPRLNRGAYLVNGPAHCGECHTPRTPFGGPMPGRFLAGGKAPSGGPDKTVPNITPSEDGIGDWSVKDIEDVLRTGILPDYETLGGDMAEVQENLAQLSDADREAIALYLKAIPPLPDTPAE